MEEKIKLIDRLLKFKNFSNLLHLTDYYIIKASCLAPEAKVAFYVKNNKVSDFIDNLHLHFPDLYIYNAYIGEGEINENVIAVLDFEDNDNNQFLTLYKEYVDLIV